MFEAWIFTPPLLSTRETYFLLQIGFDKNLLLIILMKQNSKPIVQFVLQSTSNPNRTRKLYEHNNNNICVYKSCNLDL